jgi:hypothetical protein
MTEPADPRPAWTSEARALRRAGQPVRSAECYSKVAAESRARNDSRGLAEALRHQGDALLDAGELAAAAAPLEELLPLCRTQRGLAPLALANWLRPVALLRARTNGVDAAALLAEAEALYAEAGIEAGVEEMRAVRAKLL